MDVTVAGAQASQAIGVATPPLDVYTIYTYYIKMYFI
jgi:hypothetical protein